MIRNYSVVSPSLHGVLTHESLSYEGIRRPVEVLRALDGPAADLTASRPAHQNKLLEQYFYDLYGVFMKRLSRFVLESEPLDSDTVTLQAMLQEMVKTKRLMRGCGVNGKP
ncbi:MAG: hypothetical protein WCV82_02525 [Candidatus Paceibacterota bacterium]